MRASIARLVLVAYVVAVVLVGLGVPTCRRDPEPRSP